MSDIRIPQILEKQLVERKNKTEIARDLGVSRKTITRDTQSPRYLNLWEEVTHKIINKYIDNLLELADSETSTEKMEGTKEAGRHLRTGITKQTRHTEDITIRASIDITEKRKRSEAIIKTLELTPDQFNRWTEKAESENLDK